MRSSRRVSFALLPWLAGTTAIHAREIAPPAARSAWQTLFDGAPALWGCLLVALILSAALLAQLVFLLRKSRISPQPFTEALAHAIQAGNYQEAWELCNRWRQTALARIIQPALERIGQGLPAVEARLAEERHREQRYFAMLLWGFLGLACAAAGLCLLTAAVVLGSVEGAALSSHAARALALAAGNAAVPLALAVAAGVTVLTVAPWLRIRMRTLLGDAGTRGTELLAGLPYEEIGGVRIGKDFHAGTILGDAEWSSGGPLQVSKELTTQCPTCNGPINSSRASCPHCGQLLSWS